MGEFMKISWVAIRGPGVSRMSWIGDVEHLLVTGITRDIAERCTSPFEVPPGAAVRVLDALWIPDGADGYVFTCLRRAKPDQVGDLRDRFDRVLALVRESADSQDWCPLCNAHPSSGHTPMCELAVKA